MSKIKYILLMTAFFMFLAIDVQAKSFLNTVFNNKYTELKKVSSNSQKILKAQIKNLSDRYTISPGDIISVSIFGEPDLSQKNIIIKSDGYATIHPFGEVKINGLNIDDANDLITSKFKQYIINPKVTVELNDVCTAKVYIYGAVQKPGLYQKTFDLKKDNSNFGKNFPLTLANVVVNAGGIKHNADIQNVQVINMLTGENKSYNLLEFLKNGDISQNIYLNSYDKVYVPVNNSDAQLSDEDFLLLVSSSLIPEEFPVRVLGAVKKPGIQFLNSKSPRLNSAIAASQGFTLDAKSNAVMVKRLTPQGNIATIIVNPDINDLILRPDDLIQVIDKRTTPLGKCFDFLKLLLGGNVASMGASVGCSCLFD